MGNDIKLIYKILVGGYDMTPVTYTRDSYYYNLDFCKTLVMMSEIIKEG